jgi:tetratricopeptide (TPR) repeat protein
VTVVEIPSGTKNFPVDKRAQLVADRLEAAHQNDPLWASKIEVDRVNNEVVVGLPGSKDGYVITADKQFATLRGVSPETLAYDIVDTIRTSVDPSSTPNSRDLVADDELTPTEKLNRANGLRVAGDDAYNAHDKDRAERLYQHAVRLAPQYAVPYIRLGDLYIEEKHFDEAATILQQAQTSATMTDDQKTQVAKKLALAKSKS